MRHSLAPRPHVFPLSISTFQIQSENIYNNFVPKYSVTHAARQRIGQLNDFPIGQVSYFAAASDQKPPEKTFTEIDSTEHSRIRYHALPLRPTMVHVRVLPGVN